LRGTLSESITSLSSLRGGVSRGLAASTPSRRDASQEDFTSVLARSSGRGGSPEAQARDAAEQFVSVALVQPLLAQLRASSQAAPPFAATQGEKQFQSLFDAQIAQEITRAKNFPLVERLAADLMKRGGNRSRNDATANTKEP